MVIVKFTVLLFLIVSCACYSKYYKICTDHVLCQYSTPGPGVSCKEYDSNKFLTDDEIYDLVNQINERRNFIALGNSRYLPSAANMNKLVWSEELATFAQRWVDQCDPSLRPDKEDQCRDIENAKVGQNIASIVNPSPKFNLKSFIEMWFMQLLDYNGSVTYYDQFQDYRSNYFTQLIWAETENVGCGRAKFNVHNATVDRLVCNFSPKGNIHGKPVYSIGYPRTQCKHKVTDLQKFRGLCTQSFKYKAKLLPVNLPVSSLLKILNLSNDSGKQEIDPIYNNMKQVIPNHKNEMERTKQPIMRHIFGNKEQSKKTDYPHRERHNFWKSHANVSRNNKEYFHNHVKGYPRLSHSHGDEYTDHTTKRTQKNDLREHAITGDPYDNYENLGNIKKKCTRSTEMYRRGCENNLKQSLNQKFYQCTRRLKSNWQMLQNTRVPPTNTIPNDMCPCSLHAYTAYPSRNTQRLYTLNCECMSSNGVTIRCPNLLRTHEDNLRNRPSGLESEISLKDSYLNPEDEYEWLFNNRRKNIPQKKRSGYAHSNRNRYKRNFGDTSSLKPFWQIDGFSYNENPQLKALRYTTLPNKRQRKTKRYQSKSFTTESITIKLKNSNIKPATEKYLSFDELLHLRKLNLSSNNAKRRMESESLPNPAEDKSANILRESTSEISTTEYTANTPFVRLKHCTRKLTCTWTAASLTDSNGSVVGHIDRGSRTPPGYVEGCTRTSTCTRDFMNRNKFPTTDSSTIEDDDDGAGDSDYCERRSLNKRKLNSRKKRSHSKISQKEKSSSGSIQFSYKHELSDYKTLKNNHFRRKRKLTNCKYIQNSFSYGDLYYLVLRKIATYWKNNKISDHRCPCNRAIEKYVYLHTTLLFLLHVLIMF